MTSSFNADHLLTSISQSGTGIPGTQITFAYNKANELTQLNRYNAATGGAEIGQTLYGLNAEGNVTSESLQRLPKPIGILRSVHLLTQLQDGGIIATYNFDVPDEDNQEYLRDSFSTFNFAELEEFHQRRLVEARQQGRREDTEATVESILQSSLVQDQEIWRLGAKQLAGKYISVHAVIHATISLPTVYALGIFHWAIPTTNLVIAFVFLVGDHIQKSQTATLIRQAFDKCSKIETNRGMKRGSFLGIGHSPQGSPMVEASG